MILLQLSFCHSIPCNFDSIYWLICQAGHIRAQQNEIHGKLASLILKVGILVETVKTVATFERKQLDIDFAQNVLWELITETCT